MTLQQFSTIIGNDPEAFGAKVFSFVCKPFFKKSDRGFTTKRVERQPQVLVRLSESSVGRKSVRGFTLIELLVVIAIIGILSSVVLASLNTARGKARDATRVSEVDSLNTALELYANDHDGQFPAPSTNPTCLKSTGSCWSGYVIADANIASMLAPYINSLPADPSPSRGIGDSFIYYSGTLSLHSCTTPNVTGHFIIWDPDKTTTGNDKDCLGKGYTSCCAGLSCEASYYCAYQVN